MLRPPPSSTLFPYTTLFRSTQTLTAACRLGFSLGIVATGSCVPYRSLSQGHAASMPDADWAVSRTPPNPCSRGRRSEEHTSELQSLTNLVCRLLLEKKKKHA